MNAGANPLHLDVAEFEQTLPAVAALTEADDEAEAERIARSHSIADAAICVMCVLALAWVAIGAPA